MKSSKDFEPTVMSGSDRYRQNGHGSVAPQGTIVAKKKGDLWWWIATAVIVGGGIVAIYW